MTFEWDNRKSQTCFEERGFDFAYASFVFRDHRRLEREDPRRKYKERRVQTIGEIAGTIYFVVYTKRGEVVRIISAREADDDEVKTYREGRTRT